MFGWLFGPERDIRRINRAVPEVIEYARQCFRPDTQRAIAEVTAEHLARAHRVFEPSAIGAKRAIVEYKRLHKDAQNRRDDVALTAFTLVMLYIRAELHGAPCNSARDTVDALIAEWDSAPKDAATASEDTPNDGPKDGPNDAPGDN